MSKPDLSSNRQTHIQRLYNARYAKLRRQVGKLKFVIKKAFNFTARHLCTLARLKIVFDKVVCREKIIQKLGNALSGVRTNTQYIGVATAAVFGHPRLAKIWANIRHENIAFAERSHRSCCWFAASLRNTTKVWTHVICRHIILWSDFRYRNSISDQRSNF